MKAIVNFNVTPLYIIYTVTTHTHTHRKMLLMVTQLPACFSVVSQSPAEARQSPALSMGDRTDAFGVLFSFFFLMWTRNLSFAVFHKAHPATSSEEGR